MSEGAAIVAGKQKREVFEGAHAKRTCSFSDLDMLYYFSVKKKQ